MGCEKTEATTVATTVATTSGDEVVSTGENNTNNNGQDEGRGNEAAAAATTTTAGDIQGALTSVENGGGEQAEMAVRQQMFGNFVEASVGTLPWS